MFCEGGEGSETIGFGVRDEGKTRKHTKGEEVEGEERESSLLEVEKEMDGDE